jgi:hypothetical protein
MGKNQDPDHISEELKNKYCVKILKFFDTDPVWEKFGSGIRNKHPRLNYSHQKQKLGPCI